MTYNEAYNKIIDAYFKDEIKPFDERFCFCGNLSNNCSSWNNLHSRYFEESPYTYEEYKRMELHLMNTVVLVTTGQLWQSENGIGIEVIKTVKEIKVHPDYEDALFSGMCAALDVLKQIHKGRGENVDEEIPFTKRELQKL
ncbi:MAG: hypothetical protein JWO92_2497 [Chitinophagaceae bacterium]|nr:hypothetical protein [Chitinophagaceae bacterium]